MLTEALAGAVLEPRAFAPEALEAAQGAFIDTLAVALAGSGEDCARIAQQWVREAGGAPRAPVWGTTLRASPMEAAFANGIAGHALDFDDSLTTLRGHPSVTIIPAILAAAEARGAPVAGRAALEAHVAGVEIAGLLGKAVGAGHYLRGWHTTATVGALAAAAAAARVLELDVAQLRHAWGIAASQSSGLIANLGTMTKPFHAGHAARSGVTAATLARAGFTANASVLDGAQSFLAAYAGDDGVPLAELVPAFGAPWQVLSPGIYVKRWPCCYGNHRPIGGMLKLLAANGIETGEIERIRFGFPPGSDTALVSTDPRTGLEGKFSIEYCAAAVLLDGRLSMDSFTDTMVRRPAAQALMGKVKRERIEDQGIYSGVSGYTDIAIETPRGVFSMRETNTPGSPQWRMTPEESAEKYTDCAGRVLGERGAAALLHSLNRMPELADVRELARATMPAA